MKKTLVIFSLYILLHLLSCSKTNEINICFIYPPVEYISEETKRGIILFLKEFNKKFKSYNLDINQVEVNLDKDIIRKTFLEIEEEKKPLFYIITSSFIYDSIKDDVVKNNIPVFALAAKDDIRNEISPNSTVFNYFIPTHERVIAYKNLLESKNLKNIVLVYQEEPFGIYMKELINKEIKDKDISYYAVDFTNEKIKKNINKIIQDLIKYQVIIFSLYPDNVETILKELRKIDFRGTLILPSSFNNYELIPENSKSFITGLKIHDKNYPIGFNLNKEYKKMFDKNISLFSSLSYDILKMTITFIHDKNIKNRSDIKNQFTKSFTYISVFGTIIKKEGNIISIPFKMATIKNKEVLFIED
ncbi:MAG TPA: ABC transporter substrate-binding protein [Spirochaetota bacterium]|nr:ABC transporter substrate-binding protein [Spirochaetota bacterium]HOM38627.1 ABC transporter substrate-binding protein [Spirochaetota bacterium]HPQ49764.1 ABC transporter substrate-binding protein [Spirochaetota bacterium]